MKHKLTNEECLVIHFDNEGNVLPSCRTCRRCKEWIPYPYDSECKPKENHDEISF